jgi:nucleoside 2-deoxyribosyltransferase
VNSYIERIEQSEAVVVIACNPNEIDEKIAFEMGVAIMLDKPIIAVIKPGTKIAEKLARIVDVFIEYSTPENIAEEIRQAMEELRTE